MAVDGLARPESMLERAYSEALEGVETDPSHVAVLDAAYDLFCRQGVQRSSVDEVARRAGVSRITVYRRFASKDALVEHVVRREFRRYIDQFLIDVVQEPTVADRVVAGFVSSLRAMRNNPLVGGLMASEPELLGHSVVGDGGTTLTVVAQFLAGQLRREQRAGNVAGSVDVDLVAEMMVRVSTSFLTTPGGLVDLDDDTAVGDVARRFLVPMLVEVETT